MDVKSFITFCPGFSDIKLFFSICALKVRVFEFKPSLIFKGKEFNQCDQTGRKMAHLAALGCFGLLWAALGCF
jgi:hypothetical protein